MEIRPIKTETDYEAALAEIDRLWGAAYGSPEGDKLDVLATLVEAYEEKHYPIEPSDRDEGDLRILGTQIPLTLLSYEISPVSKICSEPARTSAAISSQRASPSHSRSR